MSQDYTEFPNTDTLNVSHAKMIDNYKSFRSLNAGTSYPATLLYDGTPCWRTDLNKLYIYDGISSWEVANEYTHPSYATTNIDTTGATIVDSITTTAEGHISAMTTRVLTLADLGFTGDTNATNYSHPTHLGDDFSVDTGALSGATVVSDIDINVTTDTQGHVVDANGVVSTRTLTAANIGAQAAGTYNTIIGTDSDINTSGSTIIDNIFVTDGVITSMGTRVLTAANLGAITSVSSGDVATATAALSAGGVGTYMFARSTTSVAFGATKAGSGLLPGGIQDVTGIDAINNGAARSGTWRCMGYTSSSTYTLWLRIS